MSANKTRLNNAARKLAFATIAPAALNEGKARDAVIAALKASGARAVPDGASKSVVDYQRSIRDEYIAGRLAARLPSNGSDAERIAAARAVMAMANAKGTGDLKKGQSRRNETQERAYGAARVAWSAMLKDAGIVSTDKRGGDTSKSRKPRQTAAGAQDKPAPKGKSAPAPVLGIANKPNPAALPRVKTVQDSHTILSNMAAAALMFVDKNAAHVSNEDRSAVQAFAASIKPYGDK